MRARDELGAWYEDAAFAAAYGARGAPGISPAQLAMVTVLQFTENLTDRQAADAVRGRLDWKYCLGLGLDDDGFDFSVLSEFRSRLIAGGLDGAVFDLLLGRLKGLGLVSAGGRQRTDSTHVLARIAEVNRLELAAETIRAALEALAAAAPGWLATVIDAGWQEAYGARPGLTRPPASAAARARLAVQYGRDGYRLLEAVHGPAAPGWLRELPAMQALRAIWIQQYYRSIDARGEKVIRRDAQQQGLPPGRSRIVSAYDTGARHGEKRGYGWDGYKIHLTETCHDPGPGATRPVPNLITDVATTTAAAGDVEMTGPIQDGLAAAGLAPGEHIIDAGYTSAAGILAARARGITVTGPVQAGGSRGQAPGYTLASFTIDWDHQQATCPQGATSSSWRPATQHGTPKITVRFPAATCQACPARPQCAPTTRAGRSLSLHPRDLHETLQQARAAQDTPAWKDRYKIRAGVEGTIHQATHTTGLRTARYLGLPKTRLQHHAAAAAINLIRLDAWWTSQPPERTRTSHLTRLHLAPT
jgi:transposase